MNMLFQPSLSTHLYTIDVDTDFRLIKDAVGAADHPYVELNTVG